MGSSFDEESHQQYHHLNILFQTVKHYFNGLDALFAHVNDPRNPKKITYPLSCLLFTAVLMYLCRLGSRREINYQFRGNLRSAAKFQSLFHVECAPHGDTLNYSFKRIEIEEVQEIICSMIETLVRKKVLYPYRLLY